MITSFQNNAIQPLISICMITYNHEKYIDEAITGVLAQITTFPFELIIGEDCSNDKTMDIIRRYQKKYPEVIKVISSNINVGMQKNFERTFQACKGNYIALCEGDDYWTDYGKLQKQVTFLEDNPDFSICCHKSENYNEETQIIINEFPNINMDKELQISDLFNFNIANTCTVVYRNMGVQIPQFFSKLSLADWPLHMLHAQYGKIKYFHQNMARYRIHSSGVWALLTQQFKIDKTIEMLKLMDEHFENKYSKEINQTIGKLAFEKAKMFLKSKQFKESDLYYSKAIELKLKIKFKEKMRYLFKRRIKSLFMSKA